MAIYSEPVGTIGTWYDPETGRGYSGPKRKPTDIPADPKTGKPLKLSEAARKKAIGEISKTPENLKKTLPSKTPEDPFSLLKAALKEAANRAYKKVVKEGYEEITGKFEEMGLKPEMVKGGLASRISDFMEEYMREPIVSSLEITLDYLEDTRKRVANNLETLIDTGAISYMTDEELANIGKIVGLSTDQLKAIRDAKNAENTMGRAIAQGVMEGRIDYNSLPASLKEQSAPFIDWSKIEVKERLKRKDYTQIAQATLEKLRGPGGYVDIKAYKDVRKQWQIDTGRRASDFDEIFADMFLSSEDREKIKTSELFLFPED